MGEGSPALSRGENFIHKLLASLPPSLWSTMPLPFKQYLHFSFFYYLYWLSVSGITSYPHLFIYIFLRSQRLFFCFAFLVLIFVFVFQKWQGCVGELFGRGSRDSVYHFGAVCSHNPFWLSGKQAKEGAGTWGTGRQIPAWILSTQSAFGHNLNSLSLLVLEMGLIIVPQRVIMRMQIRRCR